MPALQLAENFLGQRDGRKTDRDRAFADAGFGADAFADVERPGKELGEQWAGGGARAAGPRGPRPRGAAPGGPARGAERGRPAPARREERDRGRAESFG